MLGPDIDLPNDLLENTAKGRGADVARSGGANRRSRVGRREPQ
jgi:hypothetical protein